MPTAFLLPWVFITAHKASTFLLQHPEIQHLMAARTYDLVVSEIMMTDAVFGLGQYFGAPTVAISMFGQSTWTNNLVGNPAPLSTVPSTFANFSTRMTMWQRLLNTVLTAFEWMMLRWMHKPIQVK